jgi:hypothetical protein
MPTLTWLLAKNIRLFMETDHYSDHDMSGRWGFSGTLCCGPYRRRSFSEDQTTEAVISWFEWTRSMGMPMD